MTRYLKSGLSVIVCFMTMLWTFGCDVVIPANVTTIEKTYTTDEDFDEGRLAGVEYGTVHDQLQMSQEPWVFSFIWISNENETVSKIDTETGRELGRYYTGPPDFDGEPSRTTVDQHGNCWLGNRYAGSVIKVGLLENDQCVDRNGNGIINTSRDLNDDGDITGEELLPWGEDECVLHEVIVIPGKEGTFVPGTYTGGYEHDWGYPGPRSLAVDAQDNVWVGTNATQTFYYLDGSTGEILQVVEVSPWSHTAYGAVIDSRGVVWSSGHNGAHVLSLDPTTDPPTITSVDVGHFAYGLGLDYLGHLFVAGWESSSLSRVDIASMQKEWTQSNPDLYQGRGVVCTSDNDVWVASSARNTVYRYDNDGNWKASIPVGATPTGVAVDAAGKVWVCDLADENIHRIDPATNTVELTKTVVGSGGHYTYSDMTGLLSRNITTRLRSWAVIFDSGQADTPWGAISWNATQPQGTVITVRVRSSDDAISWSAWEISDNDSPLRETPEGQYLQIEVTLQITEGETSPILYELTVESKPVQ